MKKMKLLNLAAIMGMGLSLSACASTQNNQNTDISDPFEESNRAVFAFNQTVDHAIINPVITGYRTVTPKPVRTGLHNFLQNLKSPVTFANQLLQGDLKGAGTVLARVTINTMAGGLGLVDIAEQEGIKYEPEDFGQTLAVWGVGHGPYLVVPFLGPASARDSTGYIVDMVADPLNNYFDNIEKESLIYWRAGATYLDTRNTLYNLLEDLERNSIDYYASVRSTYYQNRAALVEDRDEDSAPTDTSSDFDEFY